MNYGFLIRNDRCIGCHACSTACKSENDVPLGVNRTWVKSVEKGRFPDVTRTFQVTRCNHCANPPCVAICPVTAMYQRDDGIVEFDPDRCIGCKACLQACPYDAIYIDPSSGTAAKCHYCAHRTDVGLEPACVVVCPEHAIIAGDLDDPASEISRMAATHEVTVRKPEQGTRPKLFYVDGDDAALHPTATDRTPASWAWADVVDFDAPPAPADPTPRDAHPGAAHPRSAHRAADPGAAGPNGRAGRTSPDAPRPIVIGPGRMAGDMVRGVYNAQHRVPWHWPVPAYLVTKAVGAGAFLLLAMGHLLGLFAFSAPAYLALGFTSLLFTGLTTALLVVDLERPERFLRVLTRPQWRSWLTRGAYILVGFTLLVGGWWALELGASMGFWDAGWATAARPWLLGAGIPLAGGAAVYTGFLFGQAEGRDLWQSPLLPVHLLVQALMAGAAATLVIAFGVTTLGAALPEGLAAAARLTLLTTLVADFAIIVLGEFGMPHASDNAAAAAHDIVKGRYRFHFLWMALGVGHALPLGLLLAAGAPTILGPLAAAPLASVPFAPAALAPALAGLLAVVGLYYYEYAFVMAPQQVPNS